MAATSWTRPHTLTRGGSQYCAQVGPATRLLSRLSTKPGHDQRQPSPFPGTRQKGRGIGGSSGGGTGLWEVGTRGAPPARPRGPWSIRRRQCLCVAASLVAQRLKRLPAMRETPVRSLGQEDPLEKEMATHSIIPAWKIPWMEEPGGLQTMGSQRAGHD